MKALFLGLLFCFNCWSGFSQLTQSKLTISEFMANNTKTKKDRKRQFSDWLELSNTGDTPISLAGYYLTDNVKEPNKIALPNNVAIPANGYYLFWLDGSGEAGVNSLKMKFSTKGEFIGLYKDEIGWIDSLTFKEQLPDVSYGKSNEGVLGFYKKPTPGMKNTTNQFEAKLTTPSFSKEGGFYNKPQTIKLKANKGVKIYYTTNGKTPTIETGILYEKPIEIDSTLVLNAIAVKEKYLPSAANSQTFFINTQHVFPVISIATNDEILFTSTNPKLNIFKEKPVAVSYFDEQKKEIFSTRAGMRLVGKAIRNYPQKSIAIHFRENLGIKYIDYQLFTEKPKQKYYALLLRNSGNDWGNTLFKDAMMHRLVANNTSIDYQGYKPVVVYVNGKYQGIHNLREKICSHYVETNHNVDGDYIDMIEFTSLPIKGTMKHWEHMNDFIKKNDMTQQANYDSVLNWIDVDNFIDYQAAEIFYANCDWPMANMKYWRPANDTGKWRWILFDTDLAFDKNKRRVPGHHNTMNYAVGENNCHLPHLTNALTESTVILRGLMQNEMFKTRFLTRFADLMNTNFSASTIKDTINSMKHHLEPEIDMHLAKWGKKKGISSRQSWNKQINKMIEFGNERADTIRHILNQEYDLGGIHQLTIAVQGEGNVQVNSLSVSSKLFVGHYFQNLPIKLTALPENGKKFVGWEGAKGKKGTTYISLKENKEITAVFE